MAMDHSFSRLGNPSRKRNVLLFFLAAVAILFVAGLHRDCCVEKREISPLVSPVHQDVHQDVASFTNEKSPARQTFEPRCKSNLKNAERFGDSKQNKKHEKEERFNIATNEAYNNVREDDYEAPEPFRYLHDCCEDCKPPVPESPDPLVSVSWDFNHEHSNGKTKNSNRNSDSNDDYIGTPLQIYRTYDPVALYTIPSNASVVVAPPTDHSKPRLLIFEDCTIVMDWGSERAAWFEVQTEDEDLMATGVTASISEYNRPYPGKTNAMTKYGTKTYRLETNDELYEGVRFTFLHVEFPKGRDASNEREALDTRNLSEPQRLVIGDFSIVSKIKPIEYTGSFRSSNSLLTKAWYWGAYGARLNVEQHQLNSILIERGDRVAIQGDSHPTIATVLAVFYAEETKRLLAKALNDTDNAHKHVVDDGIMAYPLYWCLSAMDYYWATNDNDDALVEQLVQDIQILLDKRIQDFLDPNLDITWFGWDDRIGNGWCFHSNNDACTREALLAFAGLVIRVCNDFVNLLTSTNQTELAKIYTSHSENMTAQLRAVPEFPSGFGVHATAYAINAHMATQDEIQEHWMGSSSDGNDDNYDTPLNNAITVCSFSQFNQYWILQAYGNMERGLEHALKSIDLCWGPMMELSTGGCFWEISSPEWLTFMKEGEQAPHLPSYCHPWASGVTPWLSKVVGGVLPLTRGYLEFVAMPYVSTNYPTVDATTATPHGPIGVSAQLTHQQELHNNNDSLLSTLRGGSPSSENTLAFEATVHSKTSGYFGLRKSVICKTEKGGTMEVPLQLESIEINGNAPLEILEDHMVGSLFPGSKIGRRNTRSREYLFVKLGPGDHHVVKANYHAVVDSIWHENAIAATTASNANMTKDVSPFPPPKYPAMVLEPLDRASQGDGLLLYGKDGYSLRGTDIISDRLPSYVQNLTILQHGFPGWRIPEEGLVGYSDTNPVYLPLPENDNGKKRVLGSVGIDDQGGGDINCVLIDVRLDTETAPKEYYLSVYFAAPRPGNKHAIRVMDGETFDVIAPTKLIDDYEGGVWWTLKTDRPSVRLKMMDIEGIHISAVAFSTDLSTEISMQQAQQQENG